MKTNLSTFLEADNPYLKDAQKAVNKYKKEYASLFKSKTNHEVSLEATGPKQVTVTVKFNYFLADCKLDQQAYDQVLDDLYDFMESKSGALKIEKDGVFAGPIATSLIRPGKTIDADALLSYVQVILTYAANFK